MKFKIKSLLAYHIFHPFQSLRYVAKVYDILQMLINIVFLIKDETKFLQELMTSSQVYILISIFVIIRKYF
jgi:hypothetical protein